MEEVKKEICECKNCGNEAEMVVTCTLVEENDAPQDDKGAAPETGAPPKMKKKQTITCTHCGNEAEMWLTE